MQQILLYLLPLLACISCSNPIEINHPPSPPTAYIGWYLGDSHDLSAGAIDSVLFDFDNKVGVWDRWDDYGLWGSSYFLIKYEEEVRDSLNHVDSLRFFTYLTGPGIYVEWGGIKKNNILYLTNGFSESSGIFYRNGIKRNSPIYSIEERDPVPPEYAKDYGRGGRSGSAAWVVRKEDSSGVVWLPKAVSDRPIQRVPERIH